MQGILYFKKKKKLGNYSKMKKPVRQILDSDKKKKSPPNYQILFHRSQGGFFGFRPRVKVEFDHKEDRSGDNVIQLF